MPYYDKNGNELEYVVNIPDDKNAALGAIILEDYPKKEEKTEKNKEITGFQAMFTIFISIIFVLAIIIGTIAIWKLICMI